MATAGLPHGALQTLSSNFCDAALLLQLMCNRRLRPAERLRQRVLRNRCSCVMTAQQEPMPSPVQMFYGVVGTLANVNFTDLTLNLTAAPSMADKSKLTVSFPAC